jgi:hypothetical protein
MRCQNSTQPETEQIHTKVRTTKPP